MFNIKIGYRLAIGFGILLLLVGMLSYLAIDNMRALSEQTEKLYKHPFAVSTAVLQIESSINQLHNTHERFSADFNAEDDKGNAYLTQIEQQEQSIDKDFAFVLERFLGDPTAIKTTQATYHIWRSIIEEKIALIQDTQRQEQLTQINRHAQDLLGDLNQQMRAIVDFAKNKAEAFKTNAHSSSQESGVLFGKMYRHPFAVSKAVLEIHRDMAQLDNQLKNFRLNHDQQSQRGTLVAIEQLREQIVQNFNILQERFLGDKAKIDAAGQLFSDWESLFEKELNLLQDISRQQRLKQLNRRSVELNQQLSQYINKIIRFADNKADEFLRNAQQQSDANPVDLLSKMYQHPFTVSKAVLRIQRDIVRLNEQIKALRLSQDGNQLETLYSKIAELKQNINQDFDLVLARFLGDKQDIEQAKAIFISWDQVLEEEATLLQNLSQQQELLQIEQASQDILHKLDKSVADIIAFADNKAQSFVTDAKVVADNTSSLFTKMSHHPFAVSKAVLRITANISRLDKVMSDAIQTKNKSQRDALVRQATKYQQQIRTDFKLILERFLGDKQQINQAEAIFLQWEELLEQTTALLKDSSRADKLKQLNLNAGKQLGLLETQIAAIIAFASNKAEGFLDNARDLKQDSMSGMSWIISAVFIIGIIFAVLITVSIVRPLNRAVNLSERLVAGDLSARVEVREAHDETDQLLVAMNNMAGRLQSIISEINQVFDSLAQGHMSARIDGDFIGDFRDIKTASNSMAEKLQSVITESSSTFGQLSQGNLQVRMQGEFAGDFSQIKQAGNDMVTKLQNLISEVNLALGELAEGNMSTRIEVDFPGDFSEIKRATNSMADDLQSVISDTNAALEQLADGKMALAFNSQFSGDFIKVREALNNTAEQLGTATEQNNIQTWLKSGQGLLGEQTSGDKSLLQLSEDIINFLTPYLEAQVGAFYLLETPDTEDAEPVLKMMASHAYVWRKTNRHQFAIGESLIGQAALEHKTFVIEEPPEDYVHIQSGLGDSTPHMILVAPFLYENEVKGVLELASLVPFTEVHLEFLKQILPAIAIAINTAESRNRMKVLLEQSEAQATALRAQQAEMEQQQRRLTESNEKLTAQTEELQSQSEELQSQSEELQVQQEELTQTNETLEERTRNLERQQIEVQQKNTELEKAKTAIQTKADELEVTSKYKSEFLANMSHELRTPLNSLLILAQMLADNKAGNLNEKQIEQAQTIHNAGGDLLTLINDILDLSKVEAGKIQLHIESFELERLLDDSRKRFQPMAERKNVALLLSANDDVPSHITSDIQRIQQVITNLFSNAFKFTEQGQISLTVYRPGHDELLGMDLDEDTTLAFAVTDTGIGIPEDKVQVIFEAFQQADGTTSRRFGGTGLGLSISRQLARLLNGDIRLQSRENEGSTFTLYIPEHLRKDENDNSSDSKVSDHKLAAPVTKPQPNPVVAPMPSEPMSSKENIPAPKPLSIIRDDREQITPDDKSILIVDDDPAFVNILMQSGREEGYRCLVAENGRDGLSMAAEYLPDAIILDIGLPLVDGLTVMDKLKEDMSTRHIPVHVISAGEHGHEVKQMGALGYLLKPVNMGQLNEVFAKFRHIVDREMRRLLVLSDHDSHRDKIQNLLDMKDVEITFVSSETEALDAQAGQAFDCVVLDMDAKEALSLLENLRSHDDDNHAPLIFYAERELTDDEESYLREWHGEAALKAVYSPERLIDEVTLFLHQVDTDLPEEKRNMLHQVHDKEAVFKNKKLLLVDDDMRNVYALSTVLEHKGIQVIAAENGKQALEVLKEESNVDVILMDIMMPELDGYETMRNIRAQKTFRKTPIIALTAKAMSHDRDKCLEAGANDYMAKPVDSDQLLSLLRVWLYR